MSRLVNYTREGFGTCFCTRCDFKCGNPEGIKEHLDKEHPEWQSEPKDRAVHLAALHARVTEATPGQTSKEQREYLAALFRQCESEVRSLTTQEVLAVVVKEIGLQATSCEETGEPKHRALEQGAALRNAIKVIQSLTINGVSLEKAIDDAVGQHYESVCIELGITDGNEDADPPDGDYLLLIQNWKKKFAEGVHNEPMGQFQTTIDKMSELRQPIEDKSVCDRGHMKVNLVEVESCCSEANEYEGAGHNPNCYGEGKSITFCLACQEQKELREALSRVYNRCLSGMESDDKGLLLSIRHECEDLLDIPSTNPARQTLERKQ